MSDTDDSDRIMFDTSPFNEPLRVKSLSVGDVTIDMEDGPVVNRGDIIKVAFTPEGTFRIEDIPPDEPLFAGRLNSDQVGQIVTVEYDGSTLRGVLNEVMHYDDGGNFRTLTRLTVGDFRIDVEGAHEVKVIGWPSKRAYLG